MRLTRLDGVSSLLLPLAERPSVDPVSFEALGLQDVTGGLGANTGPAAHHQRLLRVRLVEAVPRLKRLLVQPTCILDLRHWDTVGAGDLTGFL